MFTILLIYKDQYESILTTSKVVAIVHSIDLYHLQRIPLEWLKKKKKDNLTFKYKIKVANLNYENT